MTSLFPSATPTVANIRLTPDVQTAPNYVYAGRPNGGANPAHITPGTPGYLGNPWDIRKFPDALDRHARYLDARLLEPAFAAAFDALPADVIFGCWCVDERGANPCHAKTLVKRKLERTRRAT